MPEPAPLEVHKALADDTRYRLYRYLRLSGRAVSVRELAARLSLHPNTIRPHLRRLEEAGLVASDSRACRRGRGGPSADPLHRDRPRGARGPRLPAPRRHPGEPVGERPPARPRDRARPRLGRLPRGPQRPAAGRAAPRGPEPRGAPGRARRRGVRTAVPAAELGARSRSRCATARSAISSTSIASSSAPSISGCSRGCSTPPVRRCAWSRSRLRRNAPRRARSSRASSDRAAIRTHARRGIRSYLRTRTEVAGRPGRWEACVAAAPGAAPGRIEREPDRWTLRRRRSWTSSTAGSPS